MLKWNSKLTQNSKQNILLQIFTYEKKINELIISESGRIKQFSKVVIWWSENLILSIDVKKDAIDTNDSSDKTIRLQNSSYNIRLNQSLYITVN